MVLSIDNKYDLSLKLYLKNYVEVQIISRVIVGRSSSVYACALCSRRQELALTPPAYPTTYTCPLVNSRGSLHAQTAR